MHNNRNTQPPGGSSVPNIEKHEPAQFGVATLDEAMRYAQAIAVAGLVPDAFKQRPADILIAQEIAQTMRESTWTVMSEMTIISGKPAFSAKFFRSRVRQAGHKLREYFDEETMTAKAVVIRADDPSHEHTATWNMDKAKKHGLGTKNHWLKNPSLMLKNRAVSEVVREACYEVMGGVAYTPDEVQDFAPVRNESRRMDQRPTPQSDTPVEGEVVEQQKFPEMPVQEAARFRVSLAKAQAELDLDQIDKLGAYVQKHGFREQVTMAERVQAEVQQALQSQPAQAEQVVDTPTEAPAEQSAPEYWNQNRPEPLTREQWVELCKTNATEAVEAGNTVVLDALGANAHKHGDEEIANLALDALQEISVAERAAMTTPA